MRRQQDFVDIVCVKCGHAYDGNETTILLNENPEDRSGCSQCKSKEVKTVTTRLKEPVTIYEMLSYKFQDPKGGKHKVHVHGKSGDDYFQETGEWRQLERRFDHAKNTYDEVITDANGVVIKEVHEPLTNHTGHGTDKERKGSRPSS